MFRYLLRRGVVDTLFFSDLKRYRAEEIIILLSTLIQWRFQNCKKLEYVYGHFFVKIKIIVKGEVYRFNNTNFRKVLCPLSPPYFEVLEITHKTVVV